MGSEFDPDKTGAGESPAHKTERAKDQLSQNAGEISPERAEKQGIVGKTGGQSQPEKEAGFAPGPQEEQWKDQA